MSETREQGLFDALLGDGRPALLLTAVALLLSGAFALFLALRREFLPHDIAYLGLTAAQLCELADCRVVRFMFHDRVAFGGTLIAIAILYLWLAAFPLEEKKKWAWRAFVLSGVLGFGSFLAYLGYGYLDNWHGVGTLILVPVFVIGVARTRRLAQSDAEAWLRTAAGQSAPRATRLGRMGIIATGVGMTVAGSVILALGSTEVFVKTDLAFMGMTREMLDAVTPRLVPLIAHDRAGFGGGLCSAGILVWLCGWYAPPSRSLHQALVLAGLAGFGCAIGVHYVEGYVNTMHLAPAYAGAVLFGISIGLEALAAKPSPTFSGSSLSIRHRKQP